MARLNRRTVVGLALGAAGAGLAAGGAMARDTGLAAADLRVEWLTQPVGIDTRRPRFRWLLGVDKTRRGVSAAGARVIVASSPERLAARQGDVWDSGPRKGGRLTLAPDKDLILMFHTPYWWAVEIVDADGARRWSPAARFVTGILDASEWRARWIMARPEKVRGNHVRGVDKTLADPADTALPLLRKRFDLQGLPARAVVSVSGLGHFELTVNGKPVTESVFNPGWTAYDRTALYTTYEVGDLLRPGANMLGVMLGGGMYDVEKIPGRKSKFVDSYGRPKLLLQLSLYYTDGHVKHVVSDADWQVTEGPIVFASMFGGEDVDARRERVGWNLAGADEAGWRPALAAPPQKARLKAQGVPPIVAHRRFQPVAITEPKPGVFVYDLGENFSGRPDLVVRGPAGAKVTLTPAEVLGEDGLAWQRSFNAGPDRWVLYNFTLAGQGDERFTPRFNYHGFRYLQVEGAAPAGRVGVGVPEVVSLTGEFLHADLPQVGIFDCDDPLFVRIHGLIERAVVSNAFSVLTDCPHREKLGWLEQTHLNAATILYNRDAATLYEKMIGDIVDTQQTDGMVPGIAPEYVAFLEPDGRDQDARNSPEWGAAVVLSPWAAYRAYGDPKAMADGYPAMWRYVDYLASRADGHIVDFGLGDWYDVGPGKLGASQLTSRALTGTATYYQALDALGRVARVLGRPADEALEARRRAEAVKAAFNRRFFDPTAGTYDRGSQTATAMPLALGMVPPGREGQVLDALVRAVRASNDGVTAGDVGFHYVVRALTEHGRDDVLFDMMSVKDRPSYGYQLARGATALAEAWNADPTKSLNHFMLGHGEGWLFGALAGVTVDFAAEPNRVITVAPKPVGTVNGASATYRSTLGEVKSAWRREGGVIALDVDVPAGARATVLLPTSRPDKALEAGRPAAKSQGVIAARSVKQGLEMIVGSGAYRFSASV
ncbi:alpha-L-rhamnosidase [Caulobacter segnis]|uniref:alpha-L-rhamnosidase n=1 Tax=Caulobacter segnis TaxID=88688 RepID=UPI001CBCC8A2|nr:alpha-L-rhamnosidase [Caulobacter segnis]UAL12617.1 glycoside hydrolase family 78 protein [Caulobacter segnis]